jgi:putative FmdB family regulatory protein
MLKRSIRRLVKLPLYEYECRKDGVFEQIRKFSDPPLSACPTCGGPVEKLLSAPAIQFKGTGWYITDYARKSPGAEGGKDKGGAKESPKESGSSSSESKGTSSETKASTSGSEKK